MGLITTAKKHPEADSLYVEDILCGEAAPRVVVSGLVKHIPEPDMQQRLVVVVANLKPANLKGIKSHAMVLAATGTDGKVRAALLLPVSVHLVKTGSLFRFAFCSLCSRHEFCLDRFYASCCTPANTHAHCSKLFGSWHLLK